MFNISQSFNDLILPNKSLSFITNKVIGIQSSKKKTEIQYFNDKIGPSGVLFLQETHSNSKSKQK